MNKAKFVVFGFVGVFLITALYAANWKQYKQIPMPKDATYDFYIPKSCAKVDITSWSKGHQTFKTDVRDFLNMKRAVEACGGRVELAEKK